MLCTHVHAHPRTHASKHTRANTRARKRMHANTRARKHTQEHTRTPPAHTSVLIEVDGLKPCGSIGGSSIEASYALRVAGFLLSWCSAVLYLCSRIPQIRKNYERKSTEGLSLTMFVSAMVGNGTYAASIFLQNPIIPLTSVPFLVGRSVRSPWGHLVALLGARHHPPPLNPKAASHFPSHILLRSPPMNAAYQPGDVLLRLGHFFAGDVLRPPPRWRAAARVEHAEEASAACGHADEAILCLVWVSERRPRRGYMTAGFPLPVLAWVRREFACADKPALDLRAWPPSPPLGAWLESRVHACTPRGRLRESPRDPRSSKETRALNVPRFGPGAERI